MIVIVIIIIINHSNSLTWNILLDAGSTGTRVYVYTYDKDQPYQTIDEIARERSVFPLSSFVNDTIGLTEQILSLVNFAKSKVPKTEWSKTNISLKATAGLRSLSDEHQNWLISQTSSILATSDFLFYSSETKVISGEEEALYDFLAIKILLEKNEFVIPSSVISIGAADLGGSSQQIAFAYNKNNSIIDDYIDTNRICSPDWLLGSKEIVAKSLKKRGLIAAMDEVIFKFYDNSCSNSSSNKDDNNDNEIKFHPCLPPGSTDYYEDGNREPLLGLGDFDLCLELVRNTLLEDTYFNPKCLYNHANYPYMIIGMDNYPKVLEVLKLTDNGVIAPQEIAEEGRIACKRTWTDLLSDLDRKSTRLNSSH